MPIMVIVYAMNTTLSQVSEPSAIATAARRNTLYFVIYMGIVVSGAVLTYLVWRSGNELQEATRRDADVRIAEATAATTRLQVELSAQQEKTAQAERDLLEIQERLKPRTLSPGQRSQLRAALFAGPKGSFKLWCVTGSEEAQTFALDINNVFAVAGWETNRLVMVAMHSRGLMLMVRGDTPGIPQAVPRIQSAFATIGFDLPITINNDPMIPAGTAILVVGFKPTKP